MIKQNKDIKPYPQPKNIPVLHGNYMLTDNFQYVWRSGKRFFKIVVPTKFKYDGASIPRLLWTPLGLSKDGIHRAAATVHDFLYKHEGAIGSRMFIAHKVTERWLAFPSELTRKQTDGLFYRMLRESGIGYVRAKAMHWAVRMFGAGSWGK